LRSSGCHAAELALHEFHFAHEVAEFFFALGFFTAPEDRRRMDRDENRFAVLSSKKLSSFSSDRDRPAKN